MLATRFSKRNVNQLQSDAAISEAELMRVAPSVFAQGAHESRSARYTYIPTIDVLRGLQREGFEPFFAAQSRCRVEGKAEYTKHMLRLRHADHIRRDGDVNELIIVNSHDGTSAYQLLGGCFRFVCCNGMVVGSILEDIRIKHSGDVIGEVVDGAFRMLSNFERVDASKDAFKALQLTSGEQNAFANAALALRFPDAETPDHIPVSAEQINTPRRWADRGDSLWETFQRIQENTVRGGLRVSESITRGRRTRTRAVNGIDGNVALNRGLWVLAEEMRKLRTAA